MLRLRVALYLLALALAPLVAAQEIEELHELRPVLDSTGYVGTVVIYDVNRGQYQAVYAERATHALLPASTFKIFNALVSLETGVIGSADEVVPWDGVERTRREVNEDLDLASAFRISAVPHFQILARRVGLGRMQHYVDTVGYGNRDLSGGIDQFWLTGALRISPVEQIELLTRLYREDLPFSPSTLDAVKQIMVVEEMPTYTLRAKTGWAIQGTRNVGWWVGWVERGGDAYVFATALEADDPPDDFGSARLVVTRKVLQALGILDPARAAE